MPLIEVLRLGKIKRKILYNEAMRQRALDSVFISYAFGGDDKTSDYIEDLLKVHGSYTEGFYEEERKRFVEYIKKGKK